MGWRVSFISTRTMCAYSFLCSGRVVLSLFPPLLLKTGIGGKRDITLCPGWQVLLENSVSDRKFYNVEMLEFLKREREKSDSLMMVQHHDSLSCGLLPGKNPSRSH